MPYITKERAAEILGHACLDVKTQGELNFVLTTMIVSYYRLLGEKNYAIVSEIYNSVLELSRQTPDHVTAVCNASKFNGFIYSLKAVTISYINNGNCSKEAKFALADAANEFKRRILDTYEDTKISDPNNIDPYEGL